MVFRYRWRCVEHRWTLEGMEERKSREGKSWATPLAGLVGCLTGCIAILFLIYMVGIWVLRPELPSESFEWQLFPFTLIGLPIGGIAGAYMGAIIVRKLKGRTLR